MEDWKVYSSDFIKEHLNKKLSYLDASLEMDTLKNAPLIILSRKRTLEWATRMVLEKEAKVESTAIRQMREEVKKMLEEKE